MKKLKETTAEYGLGNSRLSSEDTDWHEAVSQLSPEDMDIEIFFEAQREVIMKDDDSYSWGDLAR